MTRDETKGYILYRGSRDELNEMCRVKDERIAELENALRRRQMTHDEWNALEERVGAMTEDERRRLDDIATALDDYLVSKGGLGTICIPNRVIALACVDLTYEWNRVMLSDSGEPTDA